MKPPFTIVPTDTLPTDSLDAPQTLARPDTAGGDYANRALTDSMLAHQAAPGVQGVEGTPLPYRFRNDDFVTSALVLSFFFIIWVIARSRHYLIGKLKNFFRERESENMFTPQVETELRGVPLLIVQTCFVMGVLAADLAQELLPDATEGVSPYVPLLAATLLCLLYYLLKIGTYRFVNTVFFTRETVAKWHDLYLLAILSTGLCLFPVALLVVYFDLGARHTLIAVGAILATAKLLLFFKAFHVFSASKATWFHIILYFCTLELLPLYYLWRTAAYALSQTQTHGLDFGTLPKIFL